MQLADSMWQDCRRIPISRAPEPRRLAAWAEEHTGYVALLESGTGPSEKARYTIVAYGARRVVEERNPLEAYDALRRLASGECTSIPCRDMVFGVVGYEAVAATEPWLAPMLKQHTWPVVAVFQPETLVVYDNARGHATVCPGDAETGERGVDGWAVARGPVEETPRSTFEAWVREAIELLARGEFLQVVLSRFERYEYKEEPIALYSRLADGNPSPYMFYMRLGERWIAGSSPELLVRMENGRLETHPIAGTRPRGKTPEEDLALEEELLHDEKEQAEHLMLVDLARNDLGRYAAPGTVRVTRFMDVEKYSAVQHIVSRVEAVAQPGVDYATVLAAVNPAGTVSGAPKPRAMETIARLEDSPRGPYAGAAGVYAGYAGETAIVIRSIWSIDDSTVETRAGAGIVYDSSPEREYMETRHKLAAIRRALGVEG
ncbi:anthranilate synthase component I family protein [Pyrodictium abyssi]|uniref:anthranilate synthase n=1 Tax=Pyrodictium abyssi TaxID=54256 RepID=A0ABM8IUF0_9CREN|nr:chorismate-binding protein [Pyrodictium abyssi]